jgi:hypothetical protein
MARFDDPAGGSAGRFEFVVEIFACTYARPGRRSAR